MHQAPVLRPLDSQNAAHFARGLCMALGPANMIRAIIWLVAFIPTIAFLLIRSQDTEGGATTALAIIQGPFLLVAAGVEYFVFWKRGQLAAVAKGSPTGNVIARVLGGILFALLLLAIYQIALRP